jgi:hypothetical protein
MNSHGISATVERGSKDLYFWRLGAHQAGVAIAIFEIVSFMDSEFLLVTSLADFFNHYLKMESEKLG